MSWFWKGTFSQIRCQEYKQGCLNISCVNSQCSQYEQKSLRTRKEGKGSALAPWVFKHLLVPSFDLSMIFTTAALKGENSGWEEDGIRCADYGMRQFRMCLWRTWNEWGVESLSVRAAPAILVTGALCAPFHGSQQLTELCWYHLTGDILGSSSSNLEGGDAEVTEHNFTSRESQRGCTW